MNIHDRDEIKRLEARVAALDELAGKRAEHIETLVQSVLYEQRVKEQAQARVAALTAALASLRANSADLTLARFDAIVRAALVKHHAKCAAPDCGSELNPVAPQYYDDRGRAICPPCWWKASTNG